MSTRTTLAVWSLAFAFLAAPAAAEMYRWTDAQGNTHFTSDPTKVPAQYRKQAETKVPDRTINVPSRRSSQPARTQPRAKSAAQREYERLGGMPFQTAPPVHVPQPPNTRTSIPRYQPVQPPASTPKLPDPEPQKYEYDCSRRNANGGCRRTRSHAWDLWNARQGR